MFEGIASEMLELMASWRPTGQYPADALLLLLLPHTE